MKYLIDGIGKQALTLAKLKKYLRPDDEYRAYDPDVCPVEGFDVSRLANISRTDNDVYALNAAEGSVPFAATVDFPSALEWCDCYVTFRDIGFDMDKAYNLEDAEQSARDLVSRIQAAIDAEKYILLGNRGNELFAQIAAEYDKVLDFTYGEQELAELEPYGRNYFSEPVDVNIISVIGTSPGAGKSTAAFALRDILLEKEHETSAIIVTEETFPFFQSTDEMPVYGFCRHFSNLHLEQEFSYLQGLVGKIKAEHPNISSIIIPSQGKYGMYQLAPHYADKFRPMENLYSTLIDHALGCQYCVIAATYDRILEAQGIIDYMSLSDWPMPLAVFVSPVSTNAANNEAGCV
ncbi:MAG: hypothetical protein K2H09_02850, partial [Treponemataceae bacterium]|nr:hypothetical protein [Treponemataceae bacterium]